MGWIRTLECEQISNNNKQIRRGGLGDNKWLRFYT